MSRIEFVDPRTPEGQEALQQERFAERLEYMREPFADPKLEFLRYRIERIEDFLERQFHGFTPANATDLL